MASPKAASTSSGTPLIAAPWNGPRSAAPAQPNSIDAMAPGAPRRPEEARAALAREGPPRSRNRGAPAWNAKRTRVWTRCSLRRSTLRACYCGRALLGREARAVCRSAAHCILHSSLLALCDRPRCGGCAVQAAVACACTREGRIWVSTPAPAQNVHEQPSLTDAAAAACARATSAAACCAARLRAAISICIAARRSLSAALGWRA